MKNKLSITLSNIKQRCNNSKCPVYKYYGGRGIKCFITLEDLKILWDRDKASEMKSPSIDRIDNDGDYIFENCQFIERSDNIIKDSLGISNLKQIGKCENCGHINFYYRIRLKSFVCRICGNVWTKEKKKETK